MLTAGQRARERSERVPQLLVETQPIVSEQSYYFKLLKVILCLIEAEGLTDLLDVLHVSD